MEEQNKQRSTTALVFGWLMPPAQRRLLLMKAADRMRRLSQNLAVAHGRYAMARELRGDLDAATEGYQTAYQLMRQVHERAVKWYEQARGTIL